ncbi:MAG: GntR family transcriptional regulator [Desulfobacteraceae bacterium]|jgi:DNA-binding GntR family transcriptional regulator
MKTKENEKSRVEEAYRSIKRLMLHRKIVPGQKLLYRELIDLLHMSKTPIINALNRLEQEGFILSENNRGYTVKPIDPQEILDAYEVREALEVKAVQQAVVKGKPADRAILEEKFRACEEYSPPRMDQKKWVLDAEFHLQIAEMSGNKVLKYLLRRNFEHILLRTDLKHYALERMISSSREHEKLLKGILEKDISRSCDLLQEHVRNSATAMMKTLLKEEENELESMNFFEE